MMRGQSLKVAAFGWLRRMEQIEALTSDLPPTQLYKLRYECFCENPRDELEKLCRFLNVEFSENMLHRPTENTHHIGGSPSKFESSRVSISLDRSYENSFSPDALDQLRGVIGEAAGKWGY